MYLLILLILHLLTLTTKSNKISWMFFESFFFFQPSLPLLQFICFTCKDAEWCDWLIFDKMSDLSLNADWLTYPPIPTYFASLLLPCLSSWQLPVTISSLFDFVNLLLQIIWKISNSLSQKLGFHIDFFYLPSILFIGFFILFHFGEKACRKLNICLMQIFEAAKIL